MHILWRKWYLPARDAEGPPQRAWPPPAAAVPSVIDSQPKSLRADLPVPVPTGGKSWQKTLRRAAALANFED